MTARQDGLEGPKFVQYFAPIIEALRALGGSARPREATDWVASTLAVSDDERAEADEHRCAALLQRGGLARGSTSSRPTSSTRPVAASGHSRRRGERCPRQITGAGRAIFRSVQSEFQSTANRGDDVSVGTESDARTEEAAAFSSGPDHRAQAMEALMSLSPAGFEAFSQRLLRESGFQGVTVTGRSGDGGIDGNGILEVNPLVAFKVLFQCKKYSGVVGPGTVRDFRGAMTGRADKGIILTTGSFTADARKEAVRDGAPPIELVDGEKLVDMLEGLELGLTPVKGFRIDPAFFDGFRQ